MKIASWNLERPNQNIDSSKNQFIFDTINSLSPDIIFLTETNSAITFENFYKLESTQLPDFHENQKYSEGENRISIFSKYPFISETTTYDQFTAISTEVITEFGNLILYGSIIGSFGGKNELFMYDLNNQKTEIKSIKQNLCFSGDFNIAFSGFPYPSHKVIKETEKFFQDQHLVNVTKDNADCALHIVLSKDFLRNIMFKTELIPIARKISDHHLVFVDIY